MNADEVQARDDFKIFLEELTPQLRDPDNPTFCAGCQDRIFEAAGLCPACARLICAQCAGLAMCDFCWMESE